MSIAYSSSSSSNSHPPNPLLPLLSSTNTTSPTTTTTSTSSNNFPLYLRNRCRELIKCLYNDSHSQGIFNNPVNGANHYAIIGDADSSHKVVLFSQSDFIC